MMLESLIAVGFIAGPIDPTVNINPLIKEIEYVQLSPHTIHLVQEGETLNDIAQKHQIPLHRIFDKNLEIEHPDEIEVGTELTIPKASEELEEREIPQPVIVAPVANKTVKTAKKAPVVSHRGSTQASPTLSWWGHGQCTYWVASKRPVGFFNNASEWIWQARRDGWPTGTTPRTGAVAQKGNHVAFVESVNSDGTFNLSEMNYRNVGEVTYRTVSSVGWRFIY